MQHPKLEWAPQMQHLVSAETLSTGRADAPQDDRSRMKTAACVTKQAAEQPHLGPRSGASRFGPAAAAAAALLPAATGLRTSASETLAPTASAPTLRNRCSSTCQGQHSGFTASRCSFTSVLQCCGWMSARWQGQAALMKSGIYDLDSDKPQCRDEVHQKAARVTCVRCKPTC